MALIAQCDCGKRTGVAVVMAGRVIRCSACGDEVVVPRAVAAAVPTKSAGKSKAVSTKATPLQAQRAGRITISPTIITAAIIGGVLFVIWATLYFGPWRVGTQWAAIQDKAGDQVSDVVLFAIQSYESHHGGYNPAKPHGGPQTTGPVNFVPPMMAFTMPRSIIFMGKTNQGNYRGTYSPATGEIDCIIETGGMSVAGLVDIRKATDSFHISGREIDGKPQAEVDGQKLAIVWPKAWDER